MPSKTRSAPSSPDQRRAAAAEAEATAEAVLASVWRSCRDFAQTLSRQDPGALQQLKHVHNNGNGSCLAHSWGHGVGYLSPAEDSIPQQQTQTLRDVLASAALCYIYQGRFRGRAAFDRAERGDQRLTGVALMIAQKRANLLGLEIPERPVAETRGCSWPSRMVKCLDQNYRDPRAHLPAMACLLIAELENVNMVVLRRGDQAELLVAEFGDQPLAFIPQSGVASRTIFVLHCRGGLELAPATWEPWPGKEGARRRVSGNHYVFMYDPANAAPQLQDHAIGSDAWRQRMSAGTDRVVAMARTGAPSPGHREQRQQQQPAVIPASQQQQQQEQRPQQQQQQQPPPPPPPPHQQQNEDQHSQGQQEEQNQQQQQPQQQRQQQPPVQQQPQQQQQQQGERYALKCGSCHATLQLAPQFPGITLAAHVRKCHTGHAEEAAALVEQVRTLCAQDAAKDVPQALIKWSKTARVCTTCSVVHAQQGASCITCKRNGPPSSTVGGTATGNSSHGSTNSSSANSGSQGSVAGGITSGQNDTAAGQSAQSVQQRNPYHKPAHVAPPTTSSTAGTSSSKQSRRRSNPAPAPVMEPTWTQNDVAIAAVLDSITEAQAILLRNITSPRVSRTNRQRRQFAAVMTWVLKLLKQALDARRESAEAADAGAGVMQQRLAELSVSRAMKLLWFVPLLAYGRQTQGKGVKPKERMDALYSGTFAASLQQYLDVQLLATEQQSQQQASSTNRAQQSPVSDADNGWSEADRLMHESCAELAGQRGGVAQAARKLEAREQHAPADEQTQQVLQDKHPSAGSRPQVTDSPPDTVRAAARDALHRLQTKLQGSATGVDTAIEVTEEDVRAALDRASAGKAAGPDGGRYEHLFAAMRGDAGSACPSFDSAEEGAPEDSSGSFTGYLAEVFNILLNEPTLLPEESWRLLRAANLAGVGDKRRPIACASVWRRLMASIAARKAGHKLGPLLQELSQLGCGVPSGVEHVATTSRIWQQTFGTIIQMDCANAFNSVDRLAIIKGLERFCPELLPYFAAVYCGTTMPEMRAELRQCDGAQSDAVYITLSELGCQQGDPLGPLLFAVAIAHSLNPVDECDDAAGDDAEPQQPRAVTDEAVGRHVAYLDDLNLFVTREVDTAAADRVRTTQSRLAAIGLEVNMSKSLAVAQQGHTFSEEERRILSDLNLPFVDASTAESRQGFITVGVPVGTKLYVEQQLQKKLVDKCMWRFAWQLVGMAQTNLQAAMIIFRGSFTHKFGYIARNVDPRDSAVWLSGFDGLCAWVLERMLHLHGSTSASSIQQDITAACLAGDCEAASSPQSLAMLSAGPAGLEALPLKVARLRQGAGGLGLSNQGTTCRAAYVAQLQVTLKPSLEHVMTDAEQAPAGFAQIDAVTAYRAALQHLLSCTDLQNRQMKSGASADVLQWASSDSMIDDDQAAYDAVLAEPLRLDDKQLQDDASRDQGEETDVLRTAQQNKSNAVPGHQLTGTTAQASSDDSGNRHKGLQRRLTALFHHQAMKNMMTLLESAGGSGLLFSAQLRSQRAPFAMAWLGHAGLTEMSTVETVTMLLISLGIEPWDLQSSDADAVPQCCFCGCERATAVHMMGCAKQHIRGHNAVHTGQKRYLQRSLKRIGFNSSEVFNELGTMYTVPVGTQQSLQADTALARGSMSLCGDEVMAKQGIVLDTSITAATAAGNLVGVRSNAALTDGYACARREAEKHRKHTGRYVTSRWKFVPLVQEAHGRLGKEAAMMLSYIATEASQRSGGSKFEIASKRSRILISFKSGLSTSLAGQMAQRIFGHVRGSAVHGQYAHPASALLSLSQE